MAKFKLDFGTRQPDGSYTISSAYQSLFASIVQVGEVIGSLSAGFIGDRRGRKGAMVACVILVTLGRGPAAHSHWIHRPPCVGTCHFGYRCWYSVELYDLVSRGDSSCCDSGDDGIVVAVVFGHRTGHWSWCAQGESGKCVMHM